MRNIDYITESLKKNCLRVKVINSTECLLVFLSKSSLDVTDNMYIIHAVIAITDQISNFEEHSWVRPDGRSLKEDNLAVLNVNSFSSIALVSSGSPL